MLKLILACHLPVKQSKGLDDNQNDNKNEIKDVQSYNLMFSIQ